MNDDKNFLNFVYLYYELSSENYTISNFDLDSYFILYYIISYCIIVIWQVTVHLL